uniref:Uncharacterized protein n=1 Tax=Rhizophora mucronata TaxID=61149 RepID=A0A2P2P5V5_RHIMU
MPENLNPSLDFLFFLLFSRY